MGYWLKQRLHTESGVAAGQTYRYKLPVTGFYSAFEIRVEDQRDVIRDDAAKVPMLHELIDKIEFLTEGTKVIKSFRGRECLALNLFDFRRPNQMENGEEADSYCMENFYLLAGRSLQDKKWMFDMSKLRDPTLAITNSISSDDGVDFGITAITYEIYGWRWIGEPVPHPIGYMRADERLYYDTTGADVEKPVPISTGKKIRRLLVMGWEDAHTFRGHIKKVELQVDEGAYSPIIIANILEWCWQNITDYGLDVTTHSNFYFPDGGITNLYNLLMCYPVTCTITPSGDATHFSTRVRDYNNGVAHLVSDGADNYIVRSWGAGYLTSILLGFDKEPDLVDMLDTKGMASLKLLLTETDSADTVSMLVEEEVLY